MARILFIVPPFTGHINPTIGVASALRAHGHEVAWLGHREALYRVLPSDATVLPLGDALAGREATQLTAGREARGLAAFRFLWEEVLIPLAERSLAEVEAAIKAWAPTRLIVDQQALAGMLAARRGGYPWVSSATTSASLIGALEGLPGVQGWLDKKLADLQVRAGLEPCPQPDLSPEGVLIFSSERLARGPEGMPFPKHFHFVGPSLSGQRRSIDFPWSMLASAETPKILLSLGTLNAERGARFFREAAEALATLPVQVIAVAPDGLLERWPENFIQRSRVPQLELLSHLSLVISHGGHNTCCETLSHGIPLLLAPIKDDQPIIAEQVVRAGAGIRVKFSRVKAKKIREATRALLEEPGYRAAAEAISASFDDGAQRAADLIDAMTS